MPTDSDIFYDEIASMRHFQNGVEFWYYLDLCDLVATSDLYAFRNFTDFPEKQNEVLGKIESVWHQTKSPELKASADNGWTDPFQERHQKKMEDHARANGKTLTDYLNSINNPIDYNEFQRIKLDERTLFGAHHFMETQRRRRVVAHWVDVDNVFDVKMSRFGAFLLMRNVERPTLNVNRAILYFAMLDSDRQQFADYVDGMQRSSALAASNSLEQSVMWEIKKLGMAKRDADGVMTMAQDLMFDRFDVRGAYNIKWPEPISSYMSADLLMLRQGACETILSELRQSAKVAQTKVTDFDWKNIEKIKADLIKQVKAIIWENYKEIRAALIQADRMPEYQIKTTDAKKWKKLQTDLFRNFINYGKRRGL